MVKISCLISQLSFGLFYIHVSIFSSIDSQMLALGLACWLLLTTFPSIITVIVKSNSKREGVEKIFWKDFCDVDQTFFTEFIGKLKKPRNLLDKPEVRSMSLMTWVSTPFCDLSCLRKLIYDLHEPNGFYCQQDQQKGYFSQCLFKNTQWKL